jgi:DNA repair exonuclease SbcCD ATPase subunit
MSIIIKNLTLKNFLSIGAVTQAVNFDRKDLTLILGENLDLGGDGARNGTGKTTIIQGLSYALFGSAINQIKKDNLINRTNSKGMVASVEFSVRDVEYKIIRGRKPNILKFYINNQEQESTDDSQGDSRETQDAIERVLCMSNDMFRQIIALNTYNEPFLAMKVSDQRNIIEQLLGITLLSEKAEAIKELNKKTKEDIQKEEYRVRGIEEANKRISEQIDNLKKRQRLWLAKKNDDLSKLVFEYDELSKIDIAAELQAHKDLAIYSTKLEKVNRYNALLARQTTWREKIDKEIKELSKSYDSLSSIDISAELSAHIDLAAYTQAPKDRQIWEKSIKRAHADNLSFAKAVEKLTTEVHELSEHRCYACGQEFHDSKHQEVLSTKQQQLVDAEAEYNRTLKEWIELRDNEIIVPTKPTTHYKTEAEAIRHSSELENIKNQITSKKNEVDPYADQLAENSGVVLGEMPKPHYDTEEKAIKHSSRVSTLLDQIEKKDREEDPYVDQIHDMESSAIQVVDFTEINRLTRLLQHQDYLLDLLTNKKSFVRKRIIEQNLSYLNARLTHYLDKMGLPHQVVFQNDLSVEITELGRETDFDALSRGERNRVIIGLSLAFRDVWESLYSPVNILFVDELMDNGMDMVGMENGLALLKDLVRRRNKGVWLVSHRDELTNRVGSVLKVIKEGGFTSYSNSTDYAE